MPKATFIELGTCGYSSKSRLVLVLHCGARSARGPLATVPNQCRYETCAIIERAQERNGTVLGWGQSATTMPTSWSEVLFIIGDGGGGGESDGDGDGDGGGDDDDCREYYPTKDLSGCRFQPSFDLVVACMHACMHACMNE